MIKQVYFDKLCELFYGDKAKAWGWLKEIHPMLGASPLELVKAGKQKKVMDIINQYYNSGMRFYSK